jgi:hypothetical protein
MSKRGEDGGGASVRLSARLIDDAAPRYIETTSQATGLFMIVGQSGYISSKHHRQLSRPFDKQLLRRIVLFAT